MADILNDNNVNSDGNQIVYEGFPFISNIDRYVKNELTFRAENRIRSITPFIKVTPGFSPNGTATKKIVLKGIESENDRDPSTYTFNELYRPGAFYRPLAGVKNVTVEYKNAYGSTRKATISWICHTLEDLERLSPFFLNPGYTLLLEWGWSDKAESMINNDPKINIANAFSYGKYGQYISDGNYDCMLGVITNYNFSMNRDGGFDCTTEVISAGYLMEGMTIPNQFTTDVTDAKKRQYMAGGRSEEEAERLAQQDLNDAELREESRLKTLQYFLENDFHVQIQLDLPKYQDKNTLTDYFIYVPDKKEFDYFTNDLDNERKKDVEIKSKDTELEPETIPDYYNASTAAGSITSKREIPNPKRGQLKSTEREKVVSVPVRPAIYATWGYLEDFVLNKHVRITTADGKNNYFKFDSRNSRVTFHNNLRTTDLGVCLLPKWNPGKDGSDTDLPVPSFKRDDPDTDSTYNYGYLRRILVNVDWFREKMLDATTVIDGVLQVWSEINDVCINYWNFKIKANDQFYDDSAKEEENVNSTNTNQPIIDEQTTKKPKSMDEELQQSVNQDDVAITKYSIIDVNYANKVVAEELVNKEGNIYMFRTKTFDIQEIENKRFTSVVRNLNFQSKLSSQAALNVFYSAQNSDGKVVGTPQTNTFRKLYNYRVDGNLSNIGKDTFALYPLKIASPKIEEDDTVREPGTEDETEIQQQRVYGWASQELKRFLPVKNWGYNVVIKNSKGESIYLTGREGMKMAILLQDGRYPHIATTALVPLDCEIELEGISGLRIGNVFTIDHIPYIYRKQGVFQIIGLVDTIDKNSWVTKVKSQFRVFNDVNYEAIRGGTEQSAGRKETVIGQQRELQGEESLYDDIIFKWQEEREDYQLRLPIENPKLVKVMRQLNGYSKATFGKPIRVTDIYRTKEEQGKLTTKSRGAHIIGEAVDLSTVNYYTSEQIKKLKAYAEKLPNVTLVKYHEVATSTWHFHIEVPK